MHFAIIGALDNIEVIAKGRGIRTLALLRKRHGGKNWRKLKATATVRLVSGSIRRAEVHWYEAHGVGRVAWKIKRFVD